MAVEDQAQVSVAGSTRIGRSATGVGHLAVTGAGSNFDASEYVFVGHEGEGVMNISQQAALTAETLIVGFGGTGDGELNVADAGTTVTVQNNIQVGQWGTGVMNITNGADVKTTEPGGWIKIADQADSNGTVLVNGGSTLTAEQAPLVVGGNGHAEMTITGGSQVYSSGELFMGWGADSVGQLTISGQNSEYVSASGYPARVGDQGEGTLLIENGGYFEKPGGFILGGNSTGAGAVTLHGGEAVFKGEQLSVGEYGVGTFNVNEGRVALGDVDPADVPSGEMHLAGYYTQLTGTGTVTGDVVNFSARVRPGGDEAASLTGVLTIDGNYTQQDATLAIKIKGTIPGDEYSVLNVTGEANLGGTLHIEPIDGFDPQAGQQFTIMTFASRTGEFAAVTGPGEYDVTYNATDVTVTALFIQQLGDLSCDGLVNAFDIDPFVVALTDPDAYAAAYPDGDYMAADCDGNGLVNAFDIDPFVLLLTSR